MIILDLDGCISDDRRRLPMLGPKVGRTGKHWDAYHSLCFTDPASNHHVWHGRSDLIILTGRPQRYGFKTWAWCQHQGVCAVRAFMRPDDNYQPSPLLKQGWLEFLLEEGFHIDHAYDDRQDIIDMYHKHGVPATRLRAHELEWV